MDITKLKPGDKLIVFRYVGCQSANKGSIAIFKGLSNSSYFTKSDPGIIIQWVKQINQDGVEEEITQNDGGYFARYFQLYEEEYLKMC